VSEGTTGRQERKREWWRVNNTEIPCICVWRKYEVKYSKLLNKVDQGNSERVSNGVG
jgi:hypothetical protein